MVFLLFFPILTASVTSDEYHGSKQPSAAYHSYSPGYQDQTTADEHRPFIVLPPNEGISEKGLSGGESYHSHSYRPGVLHSRYVATNFTEDPTKNSDPFSHTPQPRDGRKDNLYESQEGSRNLELMSSSDAIENIRRMDNADELPSESSPHSVYVLPHYKQVHSLQSQKRNQDTHDREDDLRFYETSSGSDTIRGALPLDDKDHLSSERSQHAVYVLPPNKQVHSLHSQKKNQDTHDKEDDSKFYTISSGSDTVRSALPLDDENHLSSESSQHAVYVLPPNMQTHSLQSQKRNQDTHNREDDSRFYETSRGSDTIHSALPLDDEGHLSSESSQHAVYVLPPNKQAHSLQSQKRNQDTHDREDDSRFYETSSGSDTIRSALPLDDQEHLSSEDSQHAGYSYAHPSDKKAQPHQSRERIQNQNHTQEEASRHFYATSKYDNIHIIRRLDNENQFSSDSSQHVAYALPPNEQSHRPTIQNVNQEIQQREEERYFGATSMPETIPTVSPLDGEGHVSSASSQHAVYVHPPTKPTHHLPPQDIKTDTLDEEEDLRRYFDATSGSDIIPNVRRLDNEVLLSRKSLQHAVYVRPPTEETQFQKITHDNTSDHDDNLKHFIGMNGPDSRPGGHRTDEQYQLSQESSQNNVYIRPQTRTAQEPTSNKYEEERKNKTLDGNTPALVDNGLPLQHEDQSVDESIHRVTFVHPPRERINDDIRNGLQRDFNLNSPNSGTTFIDNGGYTSNQYKHLQNKGPLHSSRNYSPAHETHGESRDGQQRNMFKKNRGGSSISNHRGVSSNIHELILNKPVISAFHQLPARDIQDPHRGYHIQRERNQNSAQHGEILGVTPDPKLVQTFPHQPHNPRHQDCSHEQKYNRQQAGVIFTTPQHSPAVVVHEPGKISPTLHSQSLDSSSLGSSSYTHHFEGSSPEHNAEKKVHRSTLLSATSSPVAKSNKISSKLYDQSFESNPLESAYKQHSHYGSSEYNGETQRRRPTFSSTNNYPTTTNDRIPSNPHYQHTGNSMSQSSYNDHSHESSNEHSGYNQPQAPKLNTIFDAPIVIHTRISSNPHDQFTEKTVSRATYVDKPYENLHEKIPDKQRSVMQFDYHKANPENVIYNVSPLSSPHQPITKSSSHEAYDHQPYGGSTNDHFQQEQQKERFYQNPSDFKPFDESHDRLSSHETREESSSQYTSLHQPHEGSPDQFRNDHEEELKYHMTSRTPSDTYNSGITSKRNEQHEQELSRRTFVHQSYGASHEKDKKNQKESVKYPAPTSNPPVKFQSSLSQSGQELQSDKSTSHFDSRQTNEGDNVGMRVKHLHPMNSPHAIFHREHTSKKNGHVSNENSYNEHALDAFNREIPGRNDQQYQEHGFDSQPSSSVSHEITYPSNSLDQSSDASMSHTVVIKPPQKSIYKENHEKRTQEKKRQNLHVVPFTESLDNHHSKNDDVFVQKPSGHTKTRHELEDRSKDAFDNEVQGSTTRKLHSGMLTDFNKGVNDHNHPANQDQLPYEENHMKRFHDEITDNYKYHSMNTYKKNDDIEDARRGPVPQAKEFTQQHQKGDTDNHYTSERNHYSGERQVDITRSSVSSTAPPPNQHDEHKRTHQNEPIPYNQGKNQQFLTHERSSDSNEKGNQGVHHQHNGYVPYNGPFTRPQVIHDMSNGFGYEVASAKVEPFGTRKAQPPLGFKPNPYHNNQPTVEDHRTDNQHNQNRSVASKNHDDKPRIQHVSVSNELLRHPFGYAPFSSYQSPFMLPQEQVHVTKENRTKYASDNYKPLTYNTQDVNNGYGNHHPIGLNDHQETKRQEPPQHAYQGSPAQVQEQRQENVRTYRPQNSTRISATLTSHSADSQALPSNSYEGQYVRHPASDYNVQHSKNHNDLSPKPSFHTTSHDAIPKFNATKPHSQSEIDIRQSQYNNNDYTNKYASGVGASAESYEKASHVAPNRPVPNNHIVHSENNNTDHGQFNVLSRPTSYEEHPSRDDHGHSSGYNDNTKPLRENTPQAYENVPASTQHMLRPNVFTNENSESSPKHDSVSFEKRINPELDYSGGSHHQVSPPAGDKSRHEYPLKSAFIESDRIPHPALPIPYMNESATFAVTPVPKILTELLGSTNHHSSGLSGYFDSKHVVPAQIPYQANPLGKPLLLQSGYKEDTHEISHAKNDLVHVRHSSQSGFHYGVIT